VIGGAVCFLDQQGEEQRLAQAFAFLFHPFAPRVARKGINA